MVLHNYLKEPGFRGRAAALARALGVLDVMVSHWASGERPIPLPRCPAIERETAGAVTCEELRPDVAWMRIRDADWRWHPKGRPLVDVAVQEGAS
jgi:DNA-binding transcriptional regulator YdaS (Cro superfamily)